MVLNSYLLLTFLTIAYWKKHVPFRANKKSYSAKKSKIPNGVLASYAEAVIRIDVKAPFFRKLILTWFLMGMRICPGTLRICPMTWLIKAGISLPRTSTYFLVQNSMVSLGPHPPFSVLAGHGRCDHLLCPSFQGRGFPFLCVQGTPRLWQWFGRVNYGHSVVSLAGMLSTSDVEVFIMFNKTRYFLILS